MTGVGTDSPRNLTEFVTDSRKRLTALERQLIRDGGLALNQLLAPGAGITLEGEGTVEDPMVISAITIGLISPFGGATAPVGWVLCDGTLYLREDLPELFGVIGELYGAGDGATTFAVPDLRNRVPVGLGTSTNFDTLGKAGGAVSHSHTLSSAGWAMVLISAVAGAGVALRRITTPSWTQTHVTTTATGTAGSAANSAGTELGGSTDAAGNLPPYLTVNYIIATG